MELSFRFSGQRNISESTKTVGISQASVGVVVCSNCEMRGNKYAKGADPDKTKRERKLEKAEKLRKSRHGKRTQEKLREVKVRKDKKQKNNHLAILMESFVVRRKAVRKAMKKSQPPSKAPSEAPSEASSLPHPKPPQRRALPSRALY